MSEKSFWRLFNRHKKNNDSMYDSILDQFKQKYIGTNWQWIVSKSGSQVGSVSKIVDVNKSGDIHIATFDNDVRLNVEMLADFVVPTNKEPNGVTPAIVEEVNVTKAAPQTRFNVNENKPTTNNTQKEVVEKNMFEMFDLKETKLTLSVPINLPDKKMLKMMHENASNKDEYLNKLSKYILSYINEEAVKIAIVEFLSRNEYKKRGPNDGVPH